MTRPVYFLAAILAAIATLALGLWLGGGSRRVGVGGVASGWRELERVDSV